MSIQTGRLGGHSDNIEPEIGPIRASNANFSYADAPNVGTLRKDSGKR